MPTIDSAEGLLVIRLVYDGPALSGKTTSLKALATGVSSRLECPEERDGRTVYFDWMEYVGGLFEGRQIRCQIVSVPGQRDLAKRRKLLVETADAVVCVLDTRRGELDFGLSWLSDLASHCRGEDPPVGIVLQANKRDAPDAVPREELRARVNRVAPIAIVESVATASDGIREAFVLAVRLALDRVRALSSEGRLALGQPDERSAAELLAALRSAEASAEVTLTHRPPKRPSDPFHLALATAQEDVPAEQAEQAERIFEPDPMMPGGMIWPPVDGRALLHEVSSLAIRPARTARGDWWGSGAGWRFHSSPRALYNDHDAARGELIGWARLHSANASHISSGRAVILADAGNKRLRLWQLVRVESTLRERLDGVLSSLEANEVAEGLIDVAVELLAARTAFARASVALPCTLWTVSGQRSPRPRFVGLMPMPGPESLEEPQGRALLERELMPHLRVMRRTRVDFPAVQRELTARAELASRDSAARGLAEVALALES